MPRLHVYGFHGMLSISPSIKCPTSITHWQGFLGAGWCGQAQECKAAGGNQEQSRCQGMRFLNRPHYLLHVSSICGKCGMLYKQNKVVDRPLWRH